MVWATGAPLSRPSSSQTLSQNCHRTMHFQKLCVKDPIKLQFRQHCGEHVWYILDSIYRDQQSPSPSCLEIVSICSNYLGFFCCHKYLDNMACCLVRQFLGRTMGMVQNKYRSLGSTIILKAVIRSNMDSLHLVRAYHSFGNLVIHG